MLLEIEYQFSFKSGLVGFLKAVNIYSFFYGIYVWLQPFNPDKKNENQDIITNRKNYLFKITKKYFVNPKSGGRNFNVI